MPNANTDKVIMQALQVILPGYPTANTQLVVANGQLVIENAYQLSLGNFPAVHIEVGTQRHQVVTAYGYNGVAKFDITYFDRWDEQLNTIDAIRSGIDDDVAIMMNNVQLNPSLAYSGITHATSIPMIDLSPYKGEIDKDTVPGLTLVKRVMTLTVNILPYDA